MIVKNIIKMSAEFLDLKNVIKYLSDEIESSEDVLEEVSNLLLGVNMVNNNIASSYIELIGEKKINCKKLVIPYSEISDKSIIEIKSIVSTGGKKVGFKIMPDGVSLDSVGDYVITFSYFPEKVTLDDEINYYLKLNEITFAMGVVGEYLYIKGVIDDAYMWDKRFKNTMFNLLRPKRNIVMPAKRW